MRFIKCSLAVSIILGCTFVRAEEHEEGGEEKAGVEVKGADREWAQRKTKLNIYEAKIKDYTKEIQRFIYFKNTNTAAIDEKGKPINVLQAIAETHRKLKEATEGYNKEKEELKYRFPEEGMVIERRYVPMRFQSVEQIEKEMGLDGELTRTKKKIDKKYLTFMGDEDIKPIPQKLKGPEPTLKEIKHGEETPPRLKLSQ